jgi:hypothetical protein
MRLRRRDDAHVSETVSNSLKLRDIETHLCNSLSLLFTFPVSPMCQNLLKGYLRSWSRPVIKVAGCIPNCFLGHSCFHRYCLCPDRYLCWRSCAKESTVARNTYSTNHSPSAMLVIAARGLTNHDRVRSKCVASGSRYLMELLLLPLTEVRRALSN